MATASVLTSKVRPEVEFDPSNSEHRRLYGLLLVQVTALTKVLLIVSCSSTILTMNFLASRNSSCVRYLLVNRSNRITYGC